VSLLISMFLHLIAAVHGPNAQDSRELPRTMYRRKVRGGDDDRPRVGGEARRYG
jgi:hypothetical protein